MIFVILQYSRYRATFAETDQLRWNLENVNNLFLFQTISLFLNCMSFLNVLKLYYHLFHLQKHFSIFCQGCKKPGEVFFTYLLLENDCELFFMLYCIWLIYQHKLPIGSRSIWNINIPSYILFPCQAEAITAFSFTVRIYFPIPRLTQAVTW